MAIGERLQWKNRLYDHSKKAFLKWRNRNLQKQDRNLEQDLKTAKVRSFLEKCAIFNFFNIFKFS